jgi:hypothetical protein
LQLLLLLKQTADSPDRSQVLNLGGERDLVELGTFEDVAFSHNLEAHLSWEIDWTLPDVLRVEDPSQRGGVLFQGEDLRFLATIEWNRKNGADGGGRAAISKMAYEFGHGRFGMKALDNSMTEYDLTYDILDAVAGVPGFHFVRSVGRAWKLPPPAKCYGFPDQVRAYFQNAAFLSDFELQFEDLFARLFYLGPLREYPKRQYAWSGAQPADMGRRGEKVVDALLASREAGVRISRGKGRRRQTVEERVAEWLQTLGLIESFEVRPITKGGRLFQVWVRRHAKAPEVLITDVGFGVSQILPVITLCYYAPEGSTLILEQPEIHLHPSVQAGLADVFIDAMKTRKIQIVLESHSEHLLRRLQRRIAEEEIEADDTALYFCSTEKGESRLTKLELDLYGTIENWPEDFFGDDYEEIAATSRAAMKRKKERAG